MINLQEINPKHVRGNWNWLEIIEEISGDIFCQSVLIIMFLAFETYVWVKLFRGDISMHYLVVLDQLKSSNWQILGFNTYLASILNLKGHIANLYPKLHKYVKLLVLDAMSYSNFQKCVFHKWLSFTIGYDNKLFSKTKLSRF